MIVIDESEKKELIQATIDRLLYCPGFKKALKNLNSYYDPKEERKISNDPTEFKFPLHESI